MSRNKLIYSLFLIIFFCISCNSVNRNKEQAPGKDTSQKKNIRIEQPNAAYLVKHYWDHINKTDTLTLMKPEGAEQSLVDFLQLLPLVPADTIRESINLMLEKAQDRKTVFRHFTELCEKYLYDPNSPMRNEKWYMYVLEYIIANPKITEIDKVKAHYQYNILIKNKVGSIAKDFGYTTFNPIRKVRLYQIKSSYLLLFFYNPECDHCKETKEHLATSSLLNLLQKDKKLKVVAIYPYEDKKLWENYNAQLPANWINGWDEKGEIIKDQKYDLRALPSLYLLDNDKKVLLKDVTEEAVEQFLAR